MSIARTGHAVIALYGVVYVFGGGLSAVTRRSAEKYVINLKRWTPLPQMDTAKRGVTPCRYHNLVFLPKPGQSLEGLELTTETFKKFTLIVPVGLGKEVVAVMEQDTMVIVGNRRSGRWRFNETTELCTIELPNSLPLGIQCSCVP
ncbi:MAG: hypothetical protein J0651_03065, partial [Actinobacteria bacterium]|nr:hypothetical protein [Actinomycetota bacterium]